MHGATSQKQCETILHIAADTVQALRTGDVFRVLESAHTAGMLPEFTEWLTEKRADLIEEIGACLAEIDGV